MIVGWCIHMTSKLNTVQNGKGSKIRKGTDLRAYWDSEYWINLEKSKKVVKTSSECSLPEKPLVNS